MPRRGGRPGHGLRPDERGQVGVDGVVGVDRGRLEIDHAQIGLLVVGDVPVLVVDPDRLRLRFEPRGRRDPLLERRGQHERLERRSRLALALDGEVELALPVAPAAHHREHVPVRRVDRHERRLGSARPVHPLGDGGAGALLQPEVDRRLHAQAAAVDLAVAEPVDQLLLHVVREVRRPRRLRAGQPDAVGLRQRGVERVPVLPCVDVADVEHVGEGLGAAGACGRRSRDRVERARRRRQPREQRRLRQRQVLRALAEVDLGRLLDAVRAVAEVDRVQIGRQDPLLRPLLRELERQRGLAHLASDRLLVPDVRVLDELLRDRRAALDDALLPDVGPQRARDAADVDPVVLPESAVLHRDDGLDHARRDLVPLDQHAALVAAEHGQHGLAVVRVDVAVQDLAPVLRIERRDLARHRLHQPEAERAQAEHAQHENQSQQAELADPAPAGARRTRTSSSQRHEGPDSSAGEPMVPHGRPPPSPPGKADVRERCGESAVSPPRGGGVRLQRAVLHRPRLSSNPSTAAGSASP